MLAVKDAIQKLADEFCHYCNNQGWFFANLDDDDLEVIMGAPYWRFVHPLEIPAVLKRCAMCDKCPYPGDDSELASALGFWGRWFRDPDGIRHYIVKR